MSLIYWWPLDGTAADMVSGNEFIDNDIYYKLGGPRGIYYKFDESNPLSQSFSLDESPLTNYPQEFSISLWLRPSADQSDWGQIFTIGNNSNEWYDIRIGLLLDYNRILHFSVSSGTSYSGLDGPTVELTDGVWYHIVALYSHYGMSLYVNGERVSARSGTTIFPKLDTASILAIGGNGGEKCKADISDIRMYNHQLSQYEITKLYKSPVLHYTFNDLSFQDNPVNEAGIGGVISYKNVTIEESADLPRGRYCLNANQTQIATTFQHNDLSELTISAWVYIDDYTANNYSCILVGGVNLVIAGNGHSYVQPGTLATYGYGKNPQGYHYNSGSSAKIIPLKKWTHVAVVWDEQKVTGYIDGEIEFQKASTGVFAGGTIAKYVGSEGDGYNYPFKGKMLDVRMYPLALTEKEIKSQYQANHTIVFDGSLETGQFIESDDGKISFGKNRTIVANEFIEDITTNNFIEYVPKKLFNSNATIEYAQIIEN